MLIIPKKSSTKAHACNSSTFEVEAGKLSSRPAAIQQVQGQLSLKTPFLYLEEGRGEKERKGWGEENKFKLGM